MTSTLPRILIAVGLALAPVTATLAFAAGDSPPARSPAPGTPDAPGAPGAPDRPSDVESSPRDAPAEPSGPRDPVERPIDPAHDPRYGLLTPIPSQGAVPPIYHMLHGPSDAELIFRARSRRYESQLKELRVRFIEKKATRLQQEGLDQLREFTDPAAFQPMIEAFAHSEDWIRLEVLDHLQGQGPEGHAALAWTAIHDDDAAIRNEAAQRIERPASQAVLRVLDSALRSERHQVANNAGILAGALSATQTIPLLIFGQVTNDPVPEDQGDLAWIAIQTQTAYVQNVTPVVGDGAGAFAPVLGILNEGVVLRVVDAVAITYRTEIHGSLVAMTTHETGESTEHLGYDPRAWWAWYNEEYVPFKNEQAKRAAMEEAAVQASP